MNNPLKARQGSHSLSLVFFSSAAGGSMPETMQPLGDCHIGRRGLVVISPPLRDCIVLYRIFPASWYNLLAVKFITEEAGNMSIFNDFNDLLTSIPLNAILRERINILLERVRQLEVENATLRSENMALKSENAILRSENMALKSENAILKSENAILKSENAILKSQIMDIQIQQKHHNKGIPDGLHICPFCKKQGAQLLRIENDADFGQHLKWGFYKCNHCKKEWNKEMKIQP